MNDQNDEFCFKKLKIALIGPGGCGKSAIAVRFSLSSGTGNKIFLFEDAFWKIYQ